jgi:hypothetical protein
MTIPRRDFIKLFGASLGTLLLARCQRAGPPTPTPGMVTCYTVIAPVATAATAAPAQLAARNRLRLCWLRFGELAEKTRRGTDDGGESFRSQLIAEHRSVLDGLAASGEITVPVADLIQEAYTAAVYHVWRSNAMVTCYDMVSPDYTPESAENLVLQTDVLHRLASGGTIASGTLAKTRSALEHDLAFYALSDADVQGLYDRLFSEYSDPGGTIPSFEEVELTLTPDVKAAAQFLIDVLMGL